MIRRTTLFLLTIVAAGCGFFSRKPNQFYSLDTIPAVAGVKAIREGPIGIDGVELPPGIDRREIVTRGADHKLEMRGTHQWASPLEDMVMHTLAFNLANRLPEGSVVLPGQAKPVGAMRPLHVVFEDLAPGADGVFVLDARWTVSEVTHHERITVEGAADPENVAAAMSQALAQLADRIVAAL